MKKLLLILLLIPNFLLAESKCDYELLEDNYPDLYKKIVKKTNGVVKLFSFCADEKYYLLNLDQFSELNEGKGLPAAMVYDLHRYLLEEYKANSYARTALTIGKDNDLAIDTFIINKGDGAFGITQYIKIDNNSKERIIFGDSKTSNSANIKKSVWGGLFSETEFKLTPEQTEFLSKFKAVVDVTDFQELLQDLNK